MFYISKHLHHFFKHRPSQAPSPLEEIQGSWGHWRKQASRRPVRAALEKSTSHRFSWILEACSRGNWPSPALHWWQPGFRYLGWMLILIPCFPNHETADFITWVQKPSSLLHRLVVVFLPDLEKSQGNISWCLSLPGKPPFVCKSLFEVVCLGSTPPRRTVTTRMTWNIIIRESFPRPLFAMIKSWGGRAKLGGGFNYIFFNVHPQNWGRWTNFDECFSKQGWFNHQLVKCGLFGLKMLSFMRSRQEKSTPFNQKAVVFFFVNMFFSLKPGWQGKLSEASPWHQNDATLVYFFIFFRFEWRISRSYV